MILKVFSVYDSKVEVYLQPFFMRTKGEAIRGFSDLVNDETTQFSKYKEDYTLYELGSFHDDTGLFDMLSKPVSIGVALEFAKA